jgi:isopentenyldiphosphate isomerase
MHTDELLDLVNDKDEIIGTIWRSEYKKLVDEKLGYIRAVELFLVNDKDEFWIPKRTADKRIAPNGFDYSAAGHVSSGETYIEAVLKETEEEIALKLSIEDLEHIGKVGPDENRYIRELYIYRTNDSPNYNPQDFSSASWMHPDAIITMLNKGVPAKSTLRTTVLKVAEWLKQNS